MSLDNVLKKLKAGEYDGNFSEKEYSNGASRMLYIRDGVAESIYQGKGTDFFDNKEHIRTASRPEVTRFETDEELKEFIQKYGYKDDLFGYDEEAKEVSSQYYEERDRNR